MGEQNRKHPIQDIVTAQKQGVARGIYSCCSADPYVIKAALSRAKLYNTPVLIESTANQVDQYGGYTGMKPVDFIAFVQRLADEAGVPQEQVILGGDHLGPLTFADEPEESAMYKAAELVRQYVLAGFTKIHIDTSMRLGSDELDQPLTDEVIARRGATLCRVAEDAFEQRRRTLPDALPPVYIIGSEVPIPGGARHEEEGISVTSPEQCEHTIAAFRTAYAAQRLDDAWQRVVGVVVQPGVEFGDMQVIAYDREKAGALTAVIKRYPNMVFEGHSTDYQSKYALREMVEDSIAILKVGPALTFALREGLLALEWMEREIFTGKDVWMSGFRDTLEAVMLDAPQYWEKHYQGSGTQKRFARMFSLSDRARYYLTDPMVRASVMRLFANLKKIDIPLSLISQYMPVQYEGIGEGRLRNDLEEMLLDHIASCIDRYLYATGIIREN